MSVSRGLEVLRWSVPLDAEYSWSYNADEWGGLPPVLISSGQRDFSELYFTLDHEASTYTIGTRARTNKCNETIRTKRDVIKSQTVLAFRQGLYQLGDLIFWASVNTATELEIPPAIADRPYVQVHSQMYDSFAYIEGVEMSEHGMLVLNPAGVREGADIGTVVLLGQNSQNGAIIKISNVQLEMGFVGGNGVEKLDHFDFDWGYNAGCSVPEVFQSHVVRKGATLSKKRLELSDVNQRITAAGEVVGSVTMQVMDVDTCSTTAAGNYTADYLYGLLVLSADTCFRADPATWYVPDDPDADTGSVPSTSPVFGLILALFVAGLAAAAYLLYRRWSSPRVSGATQLRHAVESISDRPTKPDQPAERLEEPRTRIQPRGALRPPPDLQF